jgi:phage terminase small subunit
MSRPLNTRQKKFVDNYVTKGLSIAESVRRAGYSTTSGKLEDLSSYGCKLLRQDRVKAYVARLKEKAFKQDVLSFSEKRAFLARAVRTSVDQVGASSDLAQEVVEEVDTSGNVKRKIKVVDKLRALELDNKMSGDNFADRSPQVSNPFTLIIALGKTPAQGQALDDARQAASVGSLPHPSIVMDAEEVQAEAISAQD